MNDKYKSDDIFLFENDVEINFLIKKYEAVCLFGYGSFFNGESVFNDIDLLLVNNGKEHFKCATDIDKVELTVIGKVLLQRKIHGGDVFAVGSVRSSKILWQLKGVGEEILKASESKFETGLPVYCTDIKFYLQLRSNYLGIESNLISNFSNSFARFYFLSLLFDSVYLILCIKKKNWSVHQKHRLKHFSKMAPKIFQLFKTLMESNSSSDFLDCLSLINSEVVEKPVYFTHTSDRVYF